MALFPIDLPPGVYRNGTQSQAEGRYYDTDLVRFMDGTLRPIGGWRARTPSTVIGKARQIINWRDNDGVAWIAIGTHAKLYVMDRAANLYNITPLRRTASLTGPFAVTSGSATVTVTDTAHGGLVGDTVEFSGASAVGGITIAGEYVIVTRAANSYTITHSAPASSTTSGGGSVTAKYEITPGNADSSFVGGYGNWLYGRGTYGTPRPDTTNLTNITVWSLDTWGENLVACTHEDGKLYEWSLNTANRAVAIANAPTASALHVTADRILMALGADGNPRRVGWSDQEDNTDWTSTTTNYAGDFDLQTAGKLMAARKVNGGELLFTTTDVWQATFKGQPFVYGFKQKGSGCGLIAEGAVTQIDGEAVPAQAVWMSHEGFFAYNGFVRPLESDVADYVFSDINKRQAGKITAWHNAEFGEVWWFYPSANSNEIDRYVAWSYSEGHWVIGSSMPRLCGCSKGALLYPLCVDASGAIYEHEVGLEYGGAEPYAETGPFLLGEGDRVIEVNRIIPDERTLGDVTATFYVKQWPNDDQEYVKGPFTLSEKVDRRFSGRMARARFTGARLADWRVGKFKIDGYPGAMR